MALPLTGTTDVPTAGTRVQVDNTTRRVLSITFKGRVGNTGNVYVGGSTVSSTAGFELQVNQSITFDFASGLVSGVMSDFYVDAATDGNDVDFAAILWP